MNSLHETKICPRCGAQFECKVNRPLRCGCATVALDERALDSLALDYDDCLCVSCLQELAASARGDREPLP